MGKRTARRVNSLPNTYLAGSELDQLLGGGLTPQIRKQLYRVNEPKAAPFFTDGIKDLTPVPRAPLHCVIHRCFCQNCGQSHDTFGYLARKITTEKDGVSATVFKVVAHHDMNETPATYDLQHQTIPFCPSCAKVK